MFIHSMIRKEKLPLPPRPRRAGHFLLILLVHDLSSSAPVQSRPGIISPGHNRQPGSFHSAYSIISAALIKPLNNACGLSGIVQLSVLSCKTDDILSAGQIRFSLIAFVIGRGDLNSRAQVIPAPFLILHIPSDPVCCQIGITIQNFVTTAPLHNNNKKEGL